MHFFAVKCRSHPSSSFLLKLPNIACYSAHAIGSVAGTLYMYNNKKKLWSSQNCFRKEHIASVMNRLPTRKKFLAGNYFISCFHDPDSVSEVSAECEYPAHLSFWKALLEKFHYNDIKAAFTLKTTLRVLKLSLVLLPIHPSMFLWTRNLNLQTIILSAVNMQSQEHRRYYQCLVLLFKWLRYNLRNSDHNLTQPSHKNRYYHNSFTYKASHLWNQLSSYIKRSTELSEYISQAFKIF